jgi:hypothetical protein
MVKRYLVRLKGWLTLGSIGIMPRLIIAFASVAALAATANLIVEKGVAILEQQRTVAQERSALDTRQIIELRESAELARRAARSAEVLNVVAEFHHATQEYADSDSRQSAMRYARARATLKQTVESFVAEDGEEAAGLPALISGHQQTAERLVKTRQARRELLARYATLLTDMDMRIRSSVEQSWKILGRVVTREPLLEVRSHLDQLRAAFTTHGAFDAGELTTGTLAGGERALAA